MCSCLLSAFRNLVIPPEPPPTVGLSTISDGDVLNAYKLAAPNREEGNPGALASRGKALFCPSPPLMLMLVVRCGSSRGQVDRAMDREVDDIAVGWVLESALVIRLSQRSHALWRVLMRLAKELTVNVIVDSNDAILEAFQHRTAAGRGDGGLGRTAAANAR